jgi:hypothetical protein
MACNEGGLNVSLKRLKENTNWFTGPESTRLYCTNQKIYPFNQTLNLQKYTISFKCTYKFNAADGTAHSFFSCPHPPSILRVNADVTMFKTELKCPSVIHILESDLFRFIK